jgi:uncharacterized protein YkwD
MAAMSDLSAKSGVPTKELLAMGVAELQELVEKLGITDTALRLRSKEIGIDDAQIEAATKGHGGNIGAILALILKAAQDEGDVAPPVADDSIGAAHFPMFLMPCARLHQLDRIPHHEAALARGDLVRVQMVEDEMDGAAGNPSWEYCRLWSVDCATGEPKDQLVPSAQHGHGSGSKLFRIDCFHFTSHRWDTPSLIAAKAHPDSEDNSKLAHLKQVYPDSAHEFVWMDFFCVPQRNAKSQHAAISSLPYYVKHCGTFNAIVRDVKGLVEYLMRVWCELELLSSLSPIRSSSWQPKLSTQDKYFLVRPSKRYDKGVAIKVTWDWALNPLSGDVTNPADLESLKPLVGRVLSRLDDWISADKAVGPGDSERGVFGYSMGNDKYGSKALRTQVEVAKKTLDEERTADLQREMVETRVIRILETAEFAILQRSKWIRPPPDKGATAQTDGAGGMVDGGGSGEAEAIFAQLDRDGDGVLTITELTCRLADFGLSDEEITALFFRLDLNGDGQIDRSEWSAGFAAYQQAIGQQWVAPAQKDSKALAADILTAVSAARTEPSAVAKRLAQRLEHFVGDDFFNPKRGSHGNRVAIPTKEGTAAVKDAVSYLEALSQPVGALASGLIGGLTLSAEDHVDDIGGIGTTSHESSDGSTIDDQCSRYGDWSGSCGQVIWYGRVVNAVDVIDDLIVDDGVESRGHRLSIYNPAFRVAGVAVGEHKVFGQMVVVNFSAGFVEDAERIKARKTAGPPKPQASTKKTTKSKKKITTQWKDLGTCARCSEQIHGGRVVEIDGAKYHGDCFACYRCNKSLIGEEEKKKEGDELLCKACWVEEYAPTCAGCGKKIQGGVMTVTSGDKAKTKTQWHKECYEKEKKRPKVVKQRKQVKGGPKKLGGLGDSFAQPFAHHLPPELFGGGGGGAGGGLPSGSSKKQKKKGKKKQDGGGGGAAAQEDRLEAAFEEAAKRGGIVTIEKALKNMTSLGEELAALAD